MFFLFFFLIEHFYFAQYLLMFLKNLKKNSYCVLKPDSPDFSKMSILQYWKEINKINAFLRTHSFLSKKDVSIRTFTVVTLVIYNNIPLKHILFLKNILLSPGRDLNKKFESHYLKLTTTVQNLKIETLDQKIYLNCRTIRDMASVLKKLTPNLTRLQAFDHIKTFQAYAVETRRFEMKQQEWVKFSMGKIKTAEGFPIPLAHPTTTWQFKHKLDVCKDCTVTAHASSNINVELTQTQVSGGPIADLIKINAKNPGTIVSLNPEVQMIGSFKEVSIFHVEGLFYNMQDQLAEKIGFRLYFKNEKYLEEKEKNIKWIFFRHKPENYVEPTVDNITSVHYTKSRHYLNEVELLTGEIMGGAWINELSFASDSLILNAVQDEWL